MKLTTIFRIARNFAAGAAAVPFFAAHALAQAAAEAPAASAAPAAAAATPAPALNVGDTAWMLTSSILVLMMLVPGLALFYAGMVRKKNALAVLMQSFFGAGILSVIWIAVGYSLAFTEGNPFFGGFSRVMLMGITPDTLAPLAPTIPETVYVMFQLTFAIITAVIILGGPADRMKFSSAMIFLSLWVVLVYAPVAHMVWGPGGYLNTAGTLDFAGGTVVHINSAIAALVASIMIGKRIGLNTEQMVPHNVAMTMIGGSLLWVGWFGFNAGSALAAGGSAGHRHDQYASSHRSRGCVVELGRVDRARQAQLAWRGLRCACRPRGNYPGLRLRSRQWRAGHRLGRGRGLLLGRHRLQALLRL